MLLGEEITQQHALTGSTFYSADSGLGPKLFKRAIHANGSKPIDNPFADLYIIETETERLNTRAESSSSLNLTLNIAQQVLFIIATTGTITADQIKDLKARNPLLASSAGDSHHHQGGVYIHITTIKKRDGKLVTHIYMGSTQAGMIRVGTYRAGQMGFAKRTTRYTEFDKLYQQGDFDDEGYMKRRKEPASHANHWPENDQDKVIDDLWITAFSLDVPDLYAATCGGDERAGTDLMAIWKSCSTNPRIKPLQKLGVRVLFFLEAFIMLFTGFGDRHGKSGGLVDCIEKDYKQDIKRGNSTEDQIWMAHPPGYQMSSSNGRLQLYESDGHDARVMFC